MVLTAKGRYLELIRSGRKTSTIRLWDTCKVKPEQRVTFTNYRTSVRTRCTSVEGIQVRSLTAADAHADGFDTLHELLEALRAHYPALSPDTRVWVVHVALLNDSDQSVLARA